MEKIIVAAVAENNVIGNDGDIPWHIPEDLKHFKELTEGFPVIMGRKTFESLPESFRPLPNRKNIVLSRSGFKAEGTVTAKSLEEAYSIAEQDSEKVFVIGGSAVYELALSECDRLEITRVHEEYDGDTYFPEIDDENWKEISRTEKDGFSFVTYSSIS